MVNFRFHVISLVAMFLALAIGISLGSGFIGDSAQRRLQEDIDDVRDQNASVRAENADLREQLEAADGFAISARTLLIDGALQGTDVVLIRFDHTDSALSDAVSAAVQEADGEVASTVTITDKMSLATNDEIEELAEIVGSSAESAPEVRDEAAQHLGVLMAQAALQPPATDPFGARARVEEFTTALQEAGFLDVQMEDGAQEVPAEAMFVIAGGGSARPGFNSWRFAVNLAEGLVDRDATLAVVERSDSSWNLVQRVREEDSVSGSVVTVDHAETTAGQAALVLGLARAVVGVTGHYGTGDGASGALPEPSLD